MPESLTFALTSRVFAIVIYLPEPLAAFVDALRTTIAPHMPPSRSHITVLPPRPISADADRIWSTLKQRLGQQKTFPVSLSAVSVFEQTEVVYLDLGPGRETVIRIHDELVSNGARSVEPFPFHPHITLAQGLAGDDTQLTLREAGRLWNSYREAKSFQVNCFHYVRNDDGESWHDIDTVNLGTR